MTEKEKENRIHGFALNFLGQQQIIPNLYADQIIRGYKEGYHQAEKDLKVKEVDLEKEIQKHINDCLDIKFPTTDIELIKKDVEYTARKFFELGLKAQKGE